MTTVITKLIDKLTTEELIDLNTEINEKILSRFNDTQSRAFLVEDTNKTHATIVNAFGERYAVLMKYIHRI